MAFTPEQLAELGVESEDEVKAIIAETKAAKAAKADEEFQAATSVLTKEQLTGMVELFGESKADQLKGLAHLRQLGFVQDAKVEAKKDPKKETSILGLARQTTKQNDAPKSAPSSEINHQAEYDRLMKTNQIAARNYFLTHKHSILAQRSAG